MKGKLKPAKEHFSVGFTPRASTMSPLTCSRCGHSKDLHYLGAKGCFAEIDGGTCRCTYYGSLGDQAPPEDVKRRLEPEPEPRGQKAAHYSSLADSQR